MRLGLLSRTGLRLAARTLLAGVRKRVETIHFDTGPRPRPPFQVPLRIAAVGDEAHEAVARIKRHPAFDVMSVQRPEHLREQPGVHVVVVRVSDLRRTFRSAFQREVGADVPALVLALGGNWSSWAAALQAPAGAAIYVLRRDQASAVLPAIIENIARDLPLERAIKDAARSRVGRRRGSLLIIDRAANDALRLGDAAEMTRIERERAGLPPMSETIADLLQLAPVSQVTFDQPAFDGHRVIDINIMRAAYRDDRPRLLRQGTTLRRGADYILAVNTGRRLETSVIRGQQTVEAGATHGDAPDVLDVVIQEKELKCVSARQHQLVIPAIGPSKMLFFVVRTPDATGKATLRLMLYRRNEALQSYSVEAEVDEQENELVAADRGVTASLDFSQAADLRSSKMLIGRALTITVNQNPGNTHALFVKGEEGTAGFFIPESAVVRHLRDFRDILLDATYRDPARQEPRRWRVDGPGDTSRRFIRELADLGGALYREYLDDSADGVGRTLARIRTSSDSIISVVRYHEKFAFPWAILYDWRRPRLPITRTVCFGETAPGVPCGHDEGSRVYCIRGFWGYRHQIEELIGNREPQDLITSVPRPKRPGALKFLVDRNVTEWDAVEKTLAGMADSQRIMAIDSDGLLTGMWDANDRPAMLVLLGHLLQAPANPPEPSEPRIPLPPLNGMPDWLLSRDILDKITDEKPWTELNPIVLLLACESGATSPDTLGSFVTAFHRARASAIIGTECLALSDCMERFSSRFVPLVWKEGIAVGEAMTQVRRALLEQGYPLAFVFTCVGRADLRVVG